MKTAATPEEVARLLSFHSHTVDRVEKVESAWKGVTTAKILEIKKHPNADKLQLVKVTDGKGELEVVCGAWNIAVGQIVPFARVGSTVRDSKSGKPWILTAANIRGVASQGMLCAVDELGIGEDHTGIWILPPDTKIGVPLENVYPIKDTVFHIEVTSNRPDCMSVLGLAREAVAVVPKTKLINRNIKVSKSQGSAILLSVKVAEPKLCPRYEAVVMTGVKVGPSPLWMQQRLIAAGQRPINNLVDITNYVRLEYGNPLHVFDYAKLEGQKIIIRKAKAGESLLALDGKSYPLTPSDLVIADGEKPVAIAGVMGGEGSAAVANTKTIVFEVANFDPVTVRKTSRRLSLLSDSSLLFEKGLPPQSTERAMLRAIELTQQIAGGNVAGKIVDVKRPLPKPKPIVFDPELVSRALGVEIKPTLSKKILQSLGFVVSGAKTWRVTPPWWRFGDVAEPHDVVEEVARVYGYHRLPVELPTGRIPTRRLASHEVVTAQFAELLTGFGFTEVQTCSLVSGKILQAVGVKLEQCLRVANPLSAEFEFLRPTLAASMLAVVSENIKRFPRQELYELASVYHIQPKQLPSEVRMLSVAVTGDDAFMRVKGVLEMILGKIGVHYRIAAAGGSSEFWQEHGDITDDGKSVGQLGVVSAKTLERFGVRNPVAIFGLNMDILAAATHPVLAYRPIPEFPSSERDVAVVVAKALPWEKLRDAVTSVSPLVRGVAFLNTYTDAKLGSDKKSVACRIEFRADERTLSSQEIEGILQKLVAKLQHDFGAQLRQ